MRKVAVFTSTRADLWPLAPIVDGLLTDDRVRVTLLAGYWHTRDEASAAALARFGVEVSALTAAPESDTPHSFACSLGELVAQVSGALERDHPDLLVVLGDRYELLAVCAAALVHRVPIAHVHGGEVTLGSTDDLVRHAVTKMAHVHFCATELAGERVLAMDEERWRVHVTGAPSLDTFVTTARSTSEAEVVRVLGFELQRPVALVTYHPPTAVPEAVSAELEALLAGVSDLATVIVTDPGLDPGHEWIRERVHGFASARANVHLMPSLGRHYPAVVAQSDVVVGNSSSGIIEAPSVGVPTVNVGDRQAGRERAASVIDTPGEVRAVRAAVERSLDSSFRAAARACLNPYGDGTAVPKIVRVLVEQPLEPLLRKRSGIGSVA